MPSHSWRRHLYNRRSGCKELEIEHKATVSPYQSVNNWQSFEPLRGRFLFCLIFWSSQNYEPLLVIVVFIMSISNRHVGFMDCVGRLRSNTVDTNGENVMPSILDVYA
jgi:hypothetical protein